MYFITIINKIMKPKFKIWEFVKDINEYNIRYGFIESIIIYPHCIKYHIAGYNYPYEENELTKLTEEELVLYKES